MKRLTLAAVIITSLMVLAQDKKPAFPEISKSDQVSLLQKSQAVKDLQLKLAQFQTQFKDLQLQAGQLQTKFNQAQAELEKAQTELRSSERDLLLKEKLDGSKVRVNEEDLKFEPAPPESVKK